MTKLTPKDTVHKILQYVLWALLILFAAWSFCLVIVPDKWIAS